MNKTNARAVAHRSQQARRAAQREIARRLAIAFADRENIGKRTLTGTVPVPKALLLTWGR